MSHINGLIGKKARCARAAWRVVRLRLFRWTDNRWWREKVRQQLQRIAVRVDSGTWSLPEAA